MNRESARALETVLGGEGEGGKEGITGIGERWREIPKVMIRVSVLC